VNPQQSTHWPQGYSAGGIRSGLYKDRKSKKDTALFFSHVPAEASAVFTRNTVIAAPVILSQKRLKTRQPIRAVLMNSGCANACTGARGSRDAEQCARWAARGLKVSSQSILLASTGVIGTYLPMNLMKSGIRKLAAAVGDPASPHSKGPEDAAHAIMTTDTIPKIASLSAVIGGTRATFWGCAKGSGMIHPKMATMLSVILTDADAAAPFMKECLAEAAEQTFNRVSVDGETSTNDTVFLLANGAAGNARIMNVRSAGSRHFSRSILEICRRLAQMVAADGEGASKSIWIFVEGARNSTEATRFAEAVAVSPLVKTAVRGADANWGRIMGALGKTLIPFDPSRVEIRLGDLPVCRKGIEVPFKTSAIKSILARKHVTIRVLLNQGKAWSHYQTCDFTGKYVDINAGYRS
jgi:glutamate N-acetyltransferase/amino-acid N-acetyltransferase